MVKFIKNLMLYWQCKRAFRQCERKNKDRTADRYIVVLINCRPYVLNRSEWRKIRMNNRFLQPLKWEDVKRNAITREGLL